jgi:glycosyltransferase involved in cell wall biosynthesis
MVAYTFYETDGRVMRYAETLATEGATVDAIVLRKDLQPAEEMVNGVKVLRVQTRVRNETTKFSYLSRILGFFVRSMLEVTRRHLREPFDVIHVHSVPDFEVFAVWLPKLLGAKVILDIHDIVPEFYAAKFRVEHDSAIFAILKFVERISCSFADHVIAANDLWLEKLTTRSVSSEKCTVFINYPDPLVFGSIRRTRRSDNKFVLIYPGSLNWHQGLDIAIKAFALASGQASDMEFHIYGEGSARPALVALIEQLRLHDSVFLFAPMPIRRIAAVMANADLGVVPKRNDAFGGEAFSTKILEFMALGTPVVVAATRIDTHYFNDTLVRFFEPGNEEDLARKMLDAYRNREQSKQLADNALQYSRRFSWASKRHEYVDIVNNLVDNSK